MDSVLHVLLHMPHCLFRWACVTFGVASNQPVRDSETNH